MRTAIAIIFALIPSLAFGQGAIRQNGPSTKYDMLGFIQDHQAEAVSKLFTDNARGANPIHIFDAGSIGVCTEDALTTGPYHQFCLGHDSSGNPVLNATAFNGASVGSPQVNFNGTLYPLIGLAGGNVVGPNSSVVNDLMLFNTTNGQAAKGTGGDFSYANGIFSYGNANVTTTGVNKISITNTYTGTNNTPTALFGHLDFQPANGAGSNPDGLYGDIWYNAPTTFDGLGAAIRGNAYTMPQITAAIQSAGSGYTNGDVVNAVGGTCTTELNTVPQFTLTVSGGVVTAAKYVTGGACTVYPTNPISVTGGSGSGLTLNLSNSSAMNVTYLAGVYGRARHTSKGSVSNAIAIFADGAYNAGGGTTSNDVGVWLQPPYDTNFSNSYGIFAAGSFPGGTIGSAVGTDIFFNPGSGGKTKTNSELDFGTGTAPCGGALVGGGTTILQALGTSCFLVLESQVNGAINLNSGNVVLGQFSATSLSGVNYLLFASGAATGIAPAIVAAGTDTNIDLGMQGQGTGIIKFTNASSFSPNGAIATALSSVGPTGSHTTVQEWLTIKNSSGVIRYVPAF